MIVGLWLSLDYPTIAKDEAITLFRIYNLRPRIIAWRRRFLLLEIDSDNTEIVRHIIYRSATIKMGFRIYGYLFTDEEPDFDSLVPIELSNLISRAKSIGITVYKYYSNLYGDKDVSEVARTIAPYILKNFKGKIDLTKPDIRIVYLSIYDLSAIGIEIVGRHSKNYVKRIPRNRPVFSPFSLHPKMARLMINLSGVAEHEYILDPFSGVGSIPMEASLMGIHCISCEIQYKWALGSKKNVEYIGGEGYTEVICGDSLRRMIRGLKYVVTDPPYGRITSIGGKESTTNLIRDFLEYIVSIDSFKRLVYMLPEGIDIDYEKYGLKINSYYVIPVHSRLTRVLRIVERRC